MLKLVAPPSRPRRPHPVRRLGADLHRHRDSAWRPRLGHSAEHRHARERWPRCGSTSGSTGPRIVRFFQWLFGALHGDFGKSLANGRDVLDGDRAALRQYDVPGRLRGDRRRAVGDRPRPFGGDPAGRRLRPARQSRHADDDLRAGIFSRLSPHQIRRGRSRLVSFAGERHAGHERSAIGSTMRFCRC